MGIDLVVKVAKVSERKLVALRCFMEIISLNILPHYARDDSYVILLTTVTAAMLEVCWSQKCNVVNFHVLPNCVELYKTSISW